jgi:hypothetical protein
MRATRVMVLVVEEVLKVGKMAGVNGDLGGEDQAAAGTSHDLNKVNGRPQDMDNNINDAKGPYLSDVY